MGKSPAYQMYAQDFDMDTASWPSDEVGIYVRLLNYEWINHGLPADIEELARIAREKKTKFEKKWNKNLLKKFQENGHGMLINKKMEEVRENQLKYSESRRKNVSVRYKDKSTHESTHKEDMNLHTLRSSSSSSSSIKKKNILSDDEWKEKTKKLNPWIDWDQLNTEMDTWLLNNPKRQKTRRFITNWILNKQKDKPMGKSKEW